MARSKPLPNLDAEAIKRSIAPLAASVPSLEPEVLPPQPANRQSKSLARETFQETLARLWDEANSRFVEIGRLLLEYKPRLEHGEFKTWVENELPFSYSTANKLMRVAELVDAGGLPQERLPRSYETVYLLTTLTATEREKAVEEGVVSPTMKRGDVQVFKRRFREQKSVTLTQLRAKRDRMREDLKALEDEITKMESEM